MRALYSVLLSSLLVGPGCGAGAGGSAAGPTVQGVTPELGSESSNTFFVDVRTGQDSPSTNGSSSDPYRSVSFALENIGLESFDLIVFPGMYDVTVENFPIVIDYLLSSLT